jgi:hypothetical protein
MKRLLLALVLLWTLSPALARAVDLSSLKAHPRFFLSTNRVSQGDFIDSLRAEVAPGQRKNRLWQEVYGRAKYDYLPRTYTQNSDSPFKILLLFLTGKVARDSDYGAVQADSSSYINAAKGAFMCAVRGHYTWNNETLDLIVAYDWLYNYLSSAQRDTCLSECMGDFALGQENAVYYNHESNKALCKGLAGLALANDFSGADSVKAQAMVDECDGRMRGIGIYAVGGGAFSEGGVLPTRELYFGDGGYYKGIQYAHYDMQGVITYLSVWDDLGLGNYWSLCDGYVDNYPQYLLYMLRPDMLSSRLMSGTNYGIPTFGMSMLALIAAHRHNGWAAWLLDQDGDGLFDQSYGGYDFSIPAVVWRPAYTSSSDPSDLALAKFYGASGETPVAGHSYSEKVVVRSGWTFGGSTSTDSYFTIHSGGYFGDYWNFYAGAFEIYYRGALAIRSGYYLTGDAFLEAYNSRAISTNSVVVLDNTQALKDKWGQDFLYTNPGIPVDIYDVRDNPDKYQTGSILYYQDRTLTGGVHSYYVKVKINPDAAYYYTTPNRRVTTQTREVTTLGRYYVIHDKVVQTGTPRSTRFLIHTINEPTMVETASDTTVTDHITSYPLSKYSAVRGDSLSPEGMDPIKYAGKLWVQPILPAASTMRKVGGTGYEFWIDNGAGTGSNTATDPVWGDTLKFTGTDEAGQWRVETVAPLANEVDFVHAIYAGALTDTMPTIYTINETLIRGCEIKGVGTFLFAQGNRFEYEVKESFAGLHQIIYGLTPFELYWINGAECVLADASGGIAFDVNGPTRVVVGGRNGSEYVYAAEGDQHRWVQERGFQGKARYACQR